MINKINEPITAVISGGADSAMLLLLLLKQQQRVYVETVTSKEKHYRNLLSSVNVVRWCTEYTKNNNVVHNIHYVDKQTSECFRYILETKKTAKCVYGITDLPPSSAKLPNPELDNDDVRKIQGLKSVWQQNNQVYAPFINHNKKYIASLYDTYKAKELFYLTNSCESLDNIIGHCGKCWWCLERYWAFGCY